MVAALPPAERTVPAMLRRQAECFAGRPLLGLAGSTWPHQDAADAAARRAAALQAAGVGFGDRVALMCSNRIEFLETFLGCAWVGAVSVPINTAAMGPQIGYFLANSGARLLVIEAQFLSRLAHARPVAHRVAGDLGRRRRTSAVAPTLSGVPSRAYPPLRGDRIEAASDRYGRPAGHPLHLGHHRTGQGRDLSRTRSTTGGASTARGCWAWASEDVLCTTLPLFHINALNTFAQAALAGCRVGVQAALFGLGFLAGNARARRDRRLSAGRDGADPAGTAGRARRTRTPRARRPGPGVPAAAGAAFASAPA